MKRFLESADLLDTIRSETDKVNDGARKLVAGLSDEQMNWKPAPDQWSIAECLDHLTVTSAAFRTYLTEAIARGRAKWPVTSLPPYRPTWMGGWLIKQILQPAKKLPAPKVFRPSSSRITNVLDCFFEEQASFLNFAGQTAGLDYNKTRLRSPVTPLMRYSLADALVITVVHEQRHLAQARRVRDSAGFSN